MIKKFTIQILAMLFVFSMSWANNNFRQSIVKIYTVQDNPSYENPWNTHGPVTRSGSGAVISGNQILTSAHVVENSTFIQVRLYGSAKRYEANVVAISHEADLAILEVDDPTIFDEVQPFEVGDLPEIQQRIVVGGFPTGGDTLSMTVGVVSRIEHQTYVHSYLDLLAIQIDAAINAGNSGGPALSDDGKIVGIAMQTLSDSDNIAYLVPPTVIKQFLTDLEDGHNDGIPSLGLLTQELENPYLREKSHMFGDKTGCLVTRVFPGSTADGYLQNGDVFIAINGFNIADDCTVEFRENERTSYLYGIELHQVGDVVDIELSRDGQSRKVSLPLVKKMGSNSLVPVVYGRSLEYYIYGGIVFNPLTVNYLQSWGEDWYEDAPTTMLSFLERNWKNKEDEQVIILNKVLPCDLNVGYHDIYYEIVASVNGHEPRNMKDLISIIKQIDTDFVEIVLASDDKIVLKTKDVQETANTILEKYKIPAQF